MLCVRLGGQGRKGMGRENDNERALKGNPQLRSRRNSHTKVMMRTDGDGSGFRARTNTARNMSWKEFTNYLAYVIN